MGRRFQARFRSIQVLGGDARWTTIATLSHTFIAFSLVPVSNHERRIWRTLASRLEPALEGRLPASC